MKNYNIRSAVVYCGSKRGKNNLYLQAAREMGKLFIERKIRLIFGGGSIGMMGAIADTVLAGGGLVTGVIPGFLAKKEILHAGVGDMRVVDNMHQRKRLLFELSDALITLPGGYGTMEEFFEMITWAQLGLHRKPIGILNTSGYYRHLLGQLDLMVEEEFLSQENRSLVMASKSPEELLEMLESYIPPERPGVLDLDKV